MTKHIYNPVIAMIPMILMLDSCEKAPETVRDIHGEYTKSVNAPEIAAMNEVAQKLKAPAILYNSLGTFAPKDKEGMFGMIKALSASMNSIVAIDVSLCPSDFRQAWYPFRGAAQNLAVQCALLPSLEGNAEGIKSVLEKIGTEGGNLNNAQTELKAVAHKYGVEL